MAEEETPTDRQIAALQKMHGRLYDRDSAWAQHLEGSYFPRDVMRDCSRSGEPLWYLDNGSRALVRSPHCNTAVVRATVRQAGVRIAGPAPPTLVDPVAVETLRSEILTTIREWGRAIPRNRDQYENRYYQGFIVLSYCRMLHDLQAGKLGSKRTGAEWAMANLDPSWSDLIDRAWDSRLNPAVSVRQAPDPDDFERTLTFVQLVIDLSAGYAPGPPP